VWGTPRKEGSRVTRNVRSLVVSPEQVWEASQHREGDKGEVGLGGRNDRTDSIVVLSRSEIWGMSQDPLNLWTYKVRRISKVPGQDALSAKVDAIMQRIGLAPEAFGGQ
jgi:hypothetical protein